MFNIIFPSAVCLSHAEKHKRLLWVSASRDVISTMKLIKSSSPWLRLQRIKHTLTFAELSVPGVSYRLRERETQTDREKERERLGTKIRSTP